MMKVILMEVDLEVWNRLCELEMKWLFHSMNVVGDKYRVTDTIPKANAPTPPPTPPPPTPPLYQQSQIYVIKALKQGRNDLFVDDVLGAALL